VYVQVDLSQSPAAVSLEEPDDCKRFSVAVSGGSDPEHVDAALRAHDIGTVGEGGEAFVKVAAVRRLAAGRVPDSWERELDGMLEYAGTKGWLHDDGASIEAHVEYA
jgi:hypothetical protein